MQRPWLLGLLLMCQCCLGWKFDKTGNILEGEEEENGHQHHQQPRHPELEYHLPDARRVQQQQQQPEEELARDVLHDGDTYGMDKGLDRETR